MNLQDTVSTINVINTCLLLAESSENLQDAIQRMEDLKKLTIQDCDNKMFAENYKG